MNDFQNYLADEFAEDYSEGRLTRREALKLIDSVTGSLVLANAILARYAAPALAGPEPAASATPTATPTPAPPPGTPVPTPTAPGWSASASAAGRGPAASNRQRSRRSVTGGRMGGGSRTRRERQCLRPATC